MSDQSSYTLGRVQVSQVSGATAFGSTAAAAVQDSPGALHCSVLARRSMAWFKHCVCSNKISDSPHFCHIYVFCLLQTLVHPTFHAYLHLTGVVSCICSICTGPRLLPVSHSSLSSRPAQRSSQLQSHNLISVGIAVGASAAFQQFPVCHCC